MNDLTRIIEIKASSRPEAYSLALTLLKPDEYVESLTEQVPGRKPFLFLFGGRVGTYTANIAVKPIEAPPPLPGDVFLIPLRSDLFGACRVIREGDLDRQKGLLDEDGLLGMVTEWIGSSTPSLSDPRLRKPFVLTSGHFSGKVLMKWSSFGLPENFVRIGQLSPTSEELKLSCNWNGHWNHFADDILEELDARQSVTAVAEGPTAPLSNYDFRTEQQRALIQRSLAGDVATSVEDVVTSLIAIAEKSELTSWALDENTKCDHCGSTRIRDGTAIVCQRCGRRSDFQDYDEVRRHKVVAAIGRELDAKGGIELMQEVFYRFEARGGRAEFLSMAWDSIGEWRD